ncbi:MAG TPA: hypothetical protein VIF09_02000, partial [Polyangiaceae bacterium]
MSRWSSVLAGMLVAVLGVACQRSASEVPPGPPPPPIAPIAISAAPQLAAPASTSPPSPAPPAAACGDAGDVLLFASPEHPAKGEPMRVVAVADGLVDASLSLTSPDGATRAVTERQGGPPYAWIATVDAAAQGTWRASLVRSAECGSASLAARDVAVGGHHGFVPGTPRTALWFTRAAWTPSFENLYSAWIEHMFDAPLDAQPSWNALHEVLRDPARNFLFDHLGANEDQQGVVVRPDCADLPYFLRAYFAFKLGLPFGWSRCSRGENGVPPACGDFATHSNPFPKGADGKEPDLPPWADPKRSGTWESNAKRIGEF